MVYFKAIRRLLPALIMATGSSFGQVVAVQNENANYVYLGWPNRLTIAVEGLKSPEKRVCTHNGMLENDDNRGPEHYILLPKHTGFADLYIQRPTIGGKWKTIDSVFFKVKRLPTPYALLGGRTKGEVDQSFLLSQYALVTHSPGFCGGYSVVHFVIKVYRRGREIFTRTESGKSAIIDSVANDFFYTVKNGDRVIFKDIRYRTLTVLF